MSGIQVSRPSPGMPSAPTSPNDSLYPHKKNFDKEQVKITKELEKCKEQRANYPAWCALKSGLWFTANILHQCSQLVGSFVGHLVTAVVVAPVATVPGVVYATAMKTYDYLSGNKNSKSFFDYTLSVVKATCNIVYNRVTDVLCRYLVGPAVIFNLLLEPEICILIAGVGCLAACPFYYWDFKYNQSKNVEYLERLLMTSIADVMNYYVWDTFQNLSLEKISKFWTSVWSGEKKNTQLRSLGSKPVDSKPLLRDLGASQPKMELNKELSHKARDTVYAKKIETHLSKRNQQ